MDSQTKPHTLWLRALKYFDNQDIDRALYAFEMTPRTAQICFNMGLLQARMAEHRAAVECFQSAIAIEPSCAVSHFQSGVSLFYLDDFSAAHESFAITFLLLENQRSIDYKSFGLDFCLYSCEVLFNCAICLLHLGKFEEGRQMLAFAREQQLPSHVFNSFDIFGLAQPSQEVKSDDTLSSVRADYWTVFQVPHTILYRPPPVSEQPLTPISVVHMSASDDSHLPEGPPPSSPFSLSSSLSSPSKSFRLRSMNFFK